MQSESNWKGPGGPYGSEGRRDIGEKARSTAEKARSQVRSLADSSREELADHLVGVGHALRTTGDQLRSEEKSQAAHYSEMIGDQVERVARYLRDHDSDALLGEVENLARRRPLLFLGGCIAAGFALGRFFKASPGAQHPEEYREEHGEQMPIGVAYEGPSGGAYEERHGAPTPGQYQEEPTERVMPEVAPLSTAPEPLVPEEERVVITPSEPTPREGRDREER